MKYRTFPTSQFSTLHAMDEAKAHIDHRKKEAGGVKQAIRQISKEVGIPAKTLQRWYWPSKSLKNEAPKRPKPKEKHETCTISDLNELIKTGKRFGTIYADEGKNE